MPNLDKLILGIFCMLGLGLGMLGILGDCETIGETDLDCNIAFAIEAGGFTGAVGLGGSKLVNLTNCPFGPYVYPLGGEIGAPIEVVGLVGVGAGAVI